MTTANIKPTIGRAVWFRPGAAFLAANPLFTQFNPLQPMEARIVYVHHDHMVNLMVSDHVGCAWPVPSVHLLAGQYDPEQDADLYACCEWVPYQKVQAAKTEAAEKALALDASEKACTGQCAGCASTPGPVASPSGVILDPLMQLVEERANKAPRVTEGDVEAEIASAHYFTAADGVDGANLARVALGHSSDLRPLPEALGLMTFCVLVLKNGYTVVGQSAVASPVNFDAEIGRGYARRDATKKLWPLLGFRLRDSLARTSLDSGGKLVAE